MSELMDLHLSDVPDPCTVPGGEEYQLRIASGSIGPGKKDPDRTVLKVLCEVLGHPAAKPVFHNMCLPKAVEEKDNPRMALRWKQDIKEFMECFQINQARPGKPEDWVGKEGYVVLKVNEERDENEISKMVKRK